MSWSLEGRSAEVCTCQSVCICNLGPAELAEGWHAGACIWNIERGESSGIDLSGTTAAMSYVMPGDFLGGGGTARTYIGDTADPDQRRELEAIFGGERGGAFGAYDATITMLPIQTVSISIVLGDQPSATVGGIAQITLRRYKTQSGKQTTLANAEYVEHFGVTEEELCDATGSHWSDPDMRAWNGGASGVATFRMTA